MHFMTYSLITPRICSCALKARVKDERYGPHPWRCTCYVTVKVLFCEFSLLSNLALTQRRQNGLHFKVTDDARKRLQAANCEATLILDNKRDSVPRIFPRQGQERRQTSWLDAKMKKRTLTMWHFLFLFTFLPIH